MAPGRLAAIIDALPPPPSSPEFSIRKPYQDDGPRAKRRRSSRALRTYSDRPHRRPILPPNLQRLRGLDIPSPSALSNDSLSSPTSVIASDPISSDPMEPTSSLFSSPPSSPPPAAPEVKLKRSSREPIRVPLAPIFLSCNARRVAKQEVKEEVDTKERIFGKAATADENRSVKMEMTIKSETVPWRPGPPLTAHLNGTVKVETGIVKSESVAWKHDSHSTRIFKDENPAVKAEPRIRKEWPIFTFAARAHQAHSTVKSEVKAEGDDIVPRFKKDPDDLPETPAKQESRIKRESMGSCPPAASSPAQKFVGLGDISPRDIEIKDEIVVKVEPVQICLDALVKPEEPGLMFKSVIKDETSFETSFAQQTRSEGGIKSEPFTKDEPVDKAEPFIKDEPAPAPLPSASVPVEEPQLERQGFYNLPYKHYLRASQQQAALSSSAPLNPPKKKLVSSRPKAQTTLNLSTKLPFKECKLCDTVYNPLHPADVKLHQAMHDRAVRASGWQHQGSSNDRKRRRGFF